MAEFFLGALTVVVVLLLLATRTPQPYDDTDPPGGRSGLRIHVDARTGCQYLTTSSGGLTPRLDADGKHICERKEGAIHG